MWCELGSHMVIDAVVLTPARLVHDPREKLQVAILPEMRITTGSSIQVKNPVSRYELMLAGTVDMLVLRYKDERFKKRKRPVVYTGRCETH